MGSLVSLVMSDIVDSTRRWNAAEGAMAADLELHDRLIREVVEGAGGSVFKHTGDGMIAVFDDPVAAAGAAAGIQQAIGTAQWQQPDGLRIRAAVHTGVVYPRDGDLFGTAVNKLARILGVCPPGAVLVSGATAALLTDRSPEGLGLQPIGAVSLAGFATPDDAHALVGTGLVEVVAVAAAGGEPAMERAELAPIHDDLVGRVEELATIWNALDRAQLVTLVGVGGMGKTRLALEIAAGAVAAYDGAVWWIDLANATSADAVLPVSLAAVGARETAGRTALQALCDRLTGVTGLVVVDNCEHVLPAAKRMVESVRTAAPTLKVVCTSREALGLRSEQIVPIGSLPSDDGIALFCERAIAVRPDLDTVADAAVITRICARLDGIPLAIELAAARCRSMTPAEIDTRLGDRFRLLRGGRDGAERHRTLQAAVAWSYELLDPDERAVFDQLAVFAGGTLIDGLTAVTGFDEFDVLDLVDRLVARSMVVATRTTLGTRYHQLETLRQYAEDRLVEAGTIGEVRDRHLHWAVGLAARIFAAHGIDAESEAFARFAAEVDNLRVTIAHAVDSGQRDTAMVVVAMVGACALCLPVWEVFDWVRPFPAGQEWSELSAACASMASAADVERGFEHNLIESVDDVPEWYAVAPLAAKTLFIQEHTTIRNWQVGVELLDHCSPDNATERAVIGSVWCYLAWCRLGEGYVAADATRDAMVGEIEEVVAATRQSGSALSLAVTLLFGGLAASLDNPALAVQLSRDALSVSERLGASRLADLARFSVGSAAPTLELDDLVELRSALVNAIRHHDLTALAASIPAIYPMLARIDLGVAQRTLCYVGQNNSRGVSLLNVGGDLPDDPTELERLTAELSFDEVTRSLLTVFDQMIAEAAAAGSES